MEKTPFLGAENELQKIYSNLGVMVPVGDLDNGKAPAVQVLPATSTLDSITFNFNVTSSADITSITYETSSLQTGSITPKKGVVSVTFDSLDYNTELEISLYVTNASGTTTVYTAAETQHYTDWAEPESVLAGNKFIADGVELVGEIETKDSTDLTVNERTVTVPAGYYAENASASVSSDYVIPTGSTSITNNGTDINIAQYATVDVAVPNGTETLNATTNNTYYPTSPNIGFSEVVVNVPTGPGTGGATVQSCTYSTVQIGGMDIPVHTIVLDTMPADIDPETHLYGVKVFALCYNTNNGDPFCGQDIEHLADISGTELAEFDLEHNTIYDYFCSIPQDQDFQDIASTSGYVALYEDSFINPIYKWPCTIITPTNPQP